MAAQSGPRPSPYPQSNYLPNGTPSGGPPAAPTGVPAPGARPLDPNQGRVIQSGSTRILCVADVRGDLDSLNRLAKQAGAQHVIHTGDFGFYDERSLDRIADKTLKHVVQYSPLLSDQTRHHISQLPPNQSIKNVVPQDQLILSQLPQFLTGQRKFDIPVYAVWGACEDVQVLEKLRSQEYKIPNLNILDEANSRLLEVGGVKLRLLGLGGALVMHKLFDNGEGRTTIAGGQGTMWTTLLQMGELVDTAARTYDPSETRVFVTHASPSREGLLNQLGVSLKADFSISGGLHFRYGSSYNEFSVNPTLDHFRGKLAASKASFQDVWDTVKSEVQPIVAENEAHQRLLDNALAVVDKMPSVANGGNPFGGAPGQATSGVDEAAFKNMWNFNLADAAYGWLALDVEGGRIGTEMRALGFNFSHRGQKAVQQMQDPMKAPNNVPAAPMTNAVPPQQQQNAQAQVQTPSAPAVQPPQQLNQTRPGQQPRQPSAQQPSQARSAQPTPSAPAQSTQAPKSAANNARPASQTPAAQASKPASTPQTNGTPAPATANKPNGVDLDAEFGPSAPADPASASTPPPRVEPTAIYVENGPKAEEEIKELFSEDKRGKIQGVESVGRYGTAWKVNFGSPDEMRSALNSLSAEQRNQGPGSVRGKLSMKPFNTRPYDNRRPGQGYKSGSDTEGGRGRGGFGRGRGRGGSGSERGGRGRGRGGPKEGGAPTPAPAAASGS